MCIIVTSYMYIPDKMIKHCTNIYIVLILKPYINVLITIVYFILLNLFFNTISAEERDWHQETIKEIFTNYSQTYDGPRIFNHGNHIIPDFCLQDSLNKEKTNFFRIYHNSAILPWPAFPLKTLPPFSPVVFVKGYYVFDYVMPPYNDYTVTTEQVIFKNLYDQHHFAIIEYFQQYASQEHEYSATYPYDPFTIQAFTPGQILSNFKSHIQNCNDKQIVHVSVNYVKDIVPERLWSITEADLRNIHNPLMKYMDSFIDPQRNYQSDELATWIHFQTAVNTYNIGQLLNKLDDKNLETIYEINYKLMLDNYNPIK